MPDVVDGYKWELYHVADDYSQGLQFPRGEEISVGRRPRCSASARMRLCRSRTSTLAQRRTTSAPASATNVIPPTIRVPQNSSATIWAHSRGGRIRAVIISDGRR